MYNENPLFKDSQERVDGINAHYFENFWEMPNYETQGRFRSIKDSGLIFVVQNGLYGLMDSTGKLIVPCEYGYIEPFTNGMTLVRKDGKIGFIDTTGKLVVPG